MYVLRSRIWFTTILEVMINVSRRRAPKSSTIVAHVQPNQTHRWKQHFGLKLRLAGVHAQQYINHICITHFATQTKQTESILINKHKYRVNSFILQKVTNHKLQTECELAAYDSAGADSLVLALQNLKPHACLFCQSTNNHVHVTRRKRVTPEYACRGKNEIRMNRALTTGECWV